MRNQVQLITVLFAFAMLQRRRMPQLFTCISHIQIYDLIFAKTRLAPENMTIPRLELMGVLIGVCALCLQ